MAFATFRLTSVGFSPAEAQASPETDPKDAKIAELKKQAGDRDAALKRAYTQMDAMATQHRQAATKLRDEANRWEDQYKRLRYATQGDAKNAAEAVHEALTQREQMDKALYALRKEVAEQLYTRLAPDQAAEVLRHETQRLQKERETLAETVTKQRQSLRIYEEAVALFRQRETKLLTEAEMARNAARAAEAKLSTATTPVKTAAFVVNEQQQRQIHDLEAVLKRKEELYAQQLKGRQERSEQLESLVNEKEAEKRRLTAQLVESNTQLKEAREAFNYLRDYAEKLAGDLAATQQALKDVCKQRGNEHTSFMQALRQSSPGKP